MVDVYTYIIEELENVIAAGAMEKSTALDGGGRISIESARALLAKSKCVTPLSKAYLILSLIHI